MIRMAAGVLMDGLILGTVAIGHAGPFTKRKARQQAQIDQGVRGGEVTPRECTRLEREQVRVEAHRRMAWSDGRLSPWEARHLTSEQNRANRDIWRAKHNAYDAW